MQPLKDAAPELKDGLSHACVIYFASWDKHQVNESMCLEQQQCEQEFTHLKRNYPIIITIDYSGDRNVSGLLIFKYS